MATEKRLIYLEDAYEAVTDLSGQAETKSAYAAFWKAGKEIQKLPTVDAVEVVRCKDCKKWYRHTEVDRERGECRRYQTTKHETGFCDRGERKDND